MGAAYQNKCYADTASAVDAFFLSAVPTFKSNGNSVSFQNVAGVWNLVETSAASGVVATSLAPAPSLPSCDVQAGFNDGLTFGALFVGLVVSAIIFGILSKAK